MIDILRIKQILFSLIQPNPSKARYYIGLLHHQDLMLDNQERYKRIQWVRSDYLKDNWVADPFILNVTDDTIQVFVEQLYKGKGRLVLLGISLKTLEITKLKVILQLPTHLSFPYIWRENGNVYVIPENVANGNLRIWHYNKEKEELENPIVLVEEPLEDAQLCKIKDKYYIMGVKYVPNDYFNCTKHLEVYASNALYGPYSLIQTKNNSMRLERGAGSIWQEEDSIIRPAQNCENGYGTNLLFYRMTLRLDGTFSEVLEYEYLPDKTHSRSRAFHTFNEKDGYVVVDGNAYVNPRWSKFFYGMKDRIISILKH